MAKRKIKKAAKRNRPRPAKRKSIPKAQRRASNGKLPKDAVTLIVHLRAREGQEYLLEAELRALVAPTRKEPGCIIYDLHRSADAPGGFLFHEVWASRDAHTAHTKTPHFLRWNARKDSLLATRESTFWKQVA
jgi:quinol monooxygenase YgiN